LQQRSDIFQDLVLSCIDEANLPSLDKCRAPAAILELVPNIKVGCYIFSITFTAVSVVTL
jgi:poly(A) polymerase Pap1